MQNLLPEPCSLCGSGHDLYYVTLTNEVCKSFCNRETKLSSNDQGFGMKGQ